MEEMQMENTQAESTKIEGRNAVLEAFRSGKTIDKLFVLDGCKDGPIQTILREAKKHDTLVQFVAKERLEQLSETKKHQGVIAMAAAFSYATVEDILENARKKNEAPFVILLDNIEDPHNLGAIIRTAEACGAHGIIIPKRRNVGLNYIVSKTSCGALEYMPVARVTNLASTIDELKKKNIWVYAADMDGQRWDKTDFSGGVALVVGSEGNGVGRLIKEKCDVTVSLPMLGKVNSLNASVAAGIIMYEIARQRLG